MKLIYTLTREDHNSFGQLHSRKISRAIGYYLILLCVLIVLANLRGILSGELSYFTRIYALPVFIFALLWYFIMKRMGKQNTKLVEKMTGKKIEDQIYHVEADDQNLAFDRPGIESKMAWETMLKYKENDDWMLIYTGPMSVLPIPKKKATPAEDLPSFLDLVRSKLPKSVDKVSYFKI